MVKDANLYLSKSHVISPLWVQVQLGLLETSQVLLAGGQVFCRGDLTFLPHLTIDSAQNK